MARFSFPIDKAAGDFSPNYYDGDGLDGMRSKPLNTMSSLGHSLWRSQRLLVIAILSLLAFSTRVVPYSISKMPFNNDGVTEARIADDILSAGHLTYPEGSFYVDTYSVISPLYNLLIAFVSSTVGIDTFLVSQLVVAGLSVLTVVGGYVIALRISNNLLGALSAAFVLALLGTFVFLSGSAWKGSLGVAMLVVLTYAYMNRFDKRFLVLEIIALASLPLIYHLATVLAYLMLAYLTCWSMLVAVLKRRLTSSHLIDLAVVGVASLVAYAYYIGNSMQRLEDYGTPGSVVLLSVTFLALFLGTSAFLLRRKSSRMTFAPVAGTIVAFVALADYSNPVFPYTQGYGSSVVLIGIIYGLIAAFGWFGFEQLVRSESRYRAIPLGLLLPVMTLFLLAVLSGLDLEGHKVIYRTFSYADISLALGLGVAVAFFAKTKARRAVVAVITIALICSFPFGYATAMLQGDRHDTQEYEVDALGWADEHAHSSMMLRSDERLSYDARALYDFGKDPYLPSRLVSGDLSSSNVLNIMLEEWMVVGVNDYPRGHPVLDDEYVASALSISNVLYVGGPASNNLIAFQTSIVYI